MVTLLYNDNPKERTKENVLQKVDTTKNTLELIFTNFCDTLIYVEVILGE